MRKSDLFSFYAYFELNFDVNLKVYLESCFVSGKFTCLRLKNWFLDSLLCLLQLIYHGNCRVFFLPCLCYEFVYKHWCGRVGRKYFQSIYRR